MVSNDTVSGKEMTATSMDELTRKLSEWLGSPEGVTQMDETLLRAAETVETLNASMAVDTDQSRQLQFLR
jgi:hypothetical protein